MTSKVKMVGFKTVEKDSRLFAVTPTTTRELLDAYKQAEAYLYTRPEIRIMEVTRVNEDGRKVLSTMYNKAFKEPLPQEDCDPFSKFYCR